MLKAFAQIFVLKSFVTLMLITKDTCKYRYLVPRQLTRNDARPVGPMAKKDSGKKNQSNREIILQFHAQHLKGAAYLVLYCFGGKVKRFGYFFIAHAFVPA